MKILAIHAIFLLLALASLADAFRLQSKVKTTTRNGDEEWDYEACSNCTAQCGSFIWPDPTEDAHMLCVNAAGYDSCCDDFCTGICPPNACYYGIFNQCQMYGWFPI